MKNKKYYIKKNLISFIIGLIIFGGVGVYAAVTFPSNEVTYDNTDSGLSSTDVQGAIDELYGVCTAKPPGEQIIENAGLEKDPYECRYFFTGANPNNYVTFNGETAGWRIISVECDGRIKIMRTANINTSYSLAWDVAYGKDWDRPATLNTYLNGTYYNGLNNTAKSQIVASNFSIGAVEWDNNNMSTQVNDENSSKWNGKIALPTVSEYIRTNSNKSSCGTFSLINNNYSSCANTTWFNAFELQWTLTPYPGNLSGTVYDIGGRIAGGQTNDFIGGVHPTLYLSSDVTLSGSGTQSDPYVVN